MVLNGVARRVRNPVVASSAKKASQEGERKEHPQFWQTNSLWLLRVVEVMTAVGLLLSLYLNFEERVKSKDSFRGLCEINSAISCFHVTHSEYGKVLGVPVALFGVTWFIVLAAALVKLHMAYGVDRQLFSEFLLATLGWSAIGVLSVFYFIWAEWMLRTLCPLCTIIHMIVLVVLATLAKICIQIRLFPFSFSFVWHAALSHKSWLFFILLLHSLPFALYSFLPPSPGLDAKHASHVPDVAQYAATIAMCLKESGFTFYGRPNCIYCQQQKELFGDAFPFVSFIECSHPLKTPRCVQQKIEAFPTWIQVNDQGEEVARFVGLHSLEELAGLAGC